jgi:hypothetical protein
MHVSQLQWPFLFCIKCFIYLAFLDSRPLQSVGVFLLTHLVLHGLISLCWDKHVCAIKSTQVRTRLSRKICPSLHAPTFWSRKTSFTVSGVQLRYNFCFSHFTDCLIFHRLFERGLAYVGTDYRSSTLWDEYIKYEESLQAWSHLAVIYTRILEHPVQQLDRYFNWWVHWHFCSDQYSSMFFWLPPSVFILPLLF